MPQKLALGPEDGKGFDESTYRRTLSDPSVLVAKAPSPRAERSLSISVQDLLLRRHPMGPRIRDPQRVNKQVKFLQIFHDAENCFVGSTEILDLFDLRRRLFALLEDRCEAVLVDEANDPTHYLDCMSMPFEWRFYMHSVDETGSAFKPSRQDMEQFVDLGVTHIDPGSKSDAVDLKMQNDIHHFMEVHQQMKEQFLVVIISGDRDFASCLRRLVQKGFTTALVVNSNDARPSVRRIATVDCGDWEALKADCALSITSVLCTRQGRNKLWYACRHVIQDESREYQDMSTIIQDFADYHVAIIQVLRAEEDGGDLDGDLDGNGSSSSSNANPHSSWVRELRLKALSVLTAKDVELYVVESSSGEAGAGSRPSTAGASGTTNSQAPSIPFLIAALSPWTTVTGVVSNLVYGTGGQAKNLLMEAARRGREDIVSGLLNEDGMVEAVLNRTTSSPSRYTALHYAAYHGHAGVVDVLLDAGADVNIRNAAGETAVESAAHKGFDGICEKIRAVQLQQPQNDELGSAGLQILVDLHPQQLQTVQEQLEQSGAPADNDDLVNVETPDDIEKALGLSPASSRLDHAAENRSQELSEGPSDTPLRTPSHGRSQSEGARGVDDSEDDNGEDESSTAKTPMMQLNRSAVRIFNIDSDDGVTKPPNARSNSVPRPSLDRKTSWRGQAQLDSTPKHFTTQISSAAADSVGHTPGAAAVAPSSQYLARPKSLSRSFSTPTMGPGSGRSGSGSDLVTGRGSAKHTPGTGYRRVGSFTGDLSDAFSTPGSLSRSNSGFGRAPFRVCSGHIQRVRVEAWFVRVDEPVESILTCEEFKASGRGLTPGTAVTSPGLDTTPTTPADKNPQDIFFHVSECKFDAEAISSLLRFTPDLAPRVVCHVTMDKRRRLKAVNVRLLGTVIMQKDTFGFIRHEAYPKNLYYKFSDIRSNSAVNLGDLVSFEVTSHREKVWAINVRHYGVDEAFLQSPDGPASGSTLSRPGSALKRRGSGGFGSFSSIKVVGDGDDGEAVSPRGADPSAGAEGSGSYDWHPYAGDTSGGGFQSSTDGSLSSGGFLARQGSNSGGDAYASPPTRSSFGRLTRHKSAPGGAISSAAQAARGSAHNKRYGHSYGRSSGSFSRSGR